MLLAECRDGGIGLQSPAAPLYSPHEAVTHEAALMRSKHPRKSGWRSEFYTDLFEAAGGTMLESICYTATALAV